MSFGRPLSNRRGRAKYSLVVITLCGVSALGKSLGWSTTMTQPVMTGILSERGLPWPCSMGNRMTHHAEYRFDALARSESRNGAKYWFGPPSPCEPFLEPERIAAVLVIMTTPAELFIPGLAIDPDGAVIIFVDFKPQPQASARPRHFLGRRDEGRRNAAAGVPGGDGERIKPRDSTGGAKQHHG